LIFLAIVGSNRALAKACATVLDRLCTAEYHIEMCGGLELAGGAPPHGSADVPSGSDIYLWDAESHPLLPSALASPSPASKVVMASKRSLAALRRSLPHHDFQFLQTPVTPLSLKVVVEAAVVRYHQRQSSERRRLDRDKILQQLLASNLQLQEHEQKRTDSLARSMHDVRVPLMAVQGYCDLLLAGELGPMSAQQSQILARMQRSIKRLGGLFEGMAHLNQGQENDLQLNLERGHLDDCIYQALNEIRPLAERKQISLQVHLDGARGVLRFDSGKLEQALVNLLENACKFTPAGGSIRIGGQSVGTEELVGLDLAGPHGGYRIDIRDSGPGVDSALLEEIFDEHVSHAGTLDRPSSGLGLAICDAIVSAHHGKVWANPESQGASFSLVLPFAGHLENVRALQVAV
jgi:signal transduction histidine kinase